MSFHFIKCFFCDLFPLFFRGRGRDMKLLTPDTHERATPVIGSDDS